MPAGPRVGGGPCTGAQCVTQAALTGSLTTVDVEPSSFSEAGMGDRAGRDDRGWQGARGEAAGSAWWDRGRIAGGQRGCGDQRAGAEPRCLEDMRDLRSGAARPTWGEWEGCASGNACRGPLGTEVGEKGVWGRSMGGWRAGAAGVFVGDERVIG